MRERVEKIEAESSFLRDRKQRQPSVLSLIEELSAILPDDTWLEKVLYKENSITITGVSKKASLLISEIERSPLFENAAFQASVVQDNRSGGERFQIKAEITGAQRHVE